MKFSRREINLVGVALFFLLSVLVLGLFGAVIPQAKAATFFQVKPLALVYSPATIARYDAKNTEYNRWLVVQYATALAGIPYEIIHEDNLTQFGFSLTQYSALIFPENKWGNNSHLPTLLTNLTNYVNSGGGVVAFTRFFSHNESNIYVGNENIQNEVLNTKYGGKSTFTGNTWFYVNASLWITREYSVGETTNLYADSINNQEYFLTNNATKDHWEFLTMGNSTLRRAIGIASKIGNGRAVSFSLQSNYIDYVFGTGNATYMYTPMIYRAIQWVVFGDEIPVGINLVPTDLSFIIMFDGDGIYSNITRLNEASAFWNNMYEQYYTLGSLALITNDDTKWGWDWANSIWLKRGELASHSRTHAMWTEIDAVQAQDEIQNSKSDILGNLSVSVSGFQVSRTDLILNSTHNYWQYTSGYSWVRNVGMNVLGMGLIPYFTPQNIWLRASKWHAPDYNMTTITDERLIDSLDKIKHGAVSSMLWHPLYVTSGYSTDHQAYYEDIVNYMMEKDTTPLLPTQLVNRFNVFRQTSFNVTYDSNEITVSLETGQTLPFGMSLYYEDNTYVNSVTVDGNDWRAYTTNKIILPELASGTHQIVFSFGSQSSSPFINYAINGNVSSINYENEKLTFTITAPTTWISTTKVYVGNRGKPQQIRIDGASWDEGSAWTYNASTSIVTLTWTHSSTASVEISFPSSGGGGGGGESHIDTIISITQTEVTAIKATTIQITAQLKDIVGNPLSTKQIIVTCPWKMAEIFITDSAGSIHVSVLVPAILGNYTVALNFPGDTNYNPSTGTVALHVVFGETPPLSPPVDFDLATVIIGGTALAIALVWLQKKKRR